MECGKEVKCVDLQQRDLTKSSVKRRLIKNEEKRHISNCNPHRFVFIIDDVLYGAGILGEIN
jgi:hypothetical protein